VEELPLPAQWGVKGVVAAPLLAGAYYYAFSIFPLDKLDYNEVHPYVFLLPVLAYIFVRNISVTLRLYYSGFLAEMGKITLETYLMQHHIWLTSNAKTLLVLVPDWPECNMFVCTLLYVLVSRRLYRITINLRAMLIPEDFRGSLVSLAWMVAVLSDCYFAAIVLQSNKMVSGPVMAVAVTFGPQASLTSPSSPPLS
jgi:hypothetical protein